MNINTNSKQILFYGDSLVFGKKPSLPERFQANIRFTGIIQEKLGNDYNIIDEGLRARNLASENPAFTGRNGLEQFESIFSTHLPIDLLIIMLGTNDCNNSKEKTKEEFFAVFDSYIEKMKGSSSFFGNIASPKILIISPPYIDGKELEKDARLLAIFGKEAEEKSKRLSAIYSEYCKKNNFDFFDASTVCVTAINEGIHLDEENNKKLGAALAEKIKEII